MSSYSTRVAHRALDSYQLTLKVCAKADSACNRWLMFARALERMSQHSFQVKIRSHFFSFCRIGEDRSRVSLSEPQLHMGGNQPFVAMRGIVPVVCIALLLLASQPADAQGSFFYLIRRASCSSLADTQNCIACITWHHLAPSHRVSSQGVPAG